MQPTRPRELRSSLRTSGSGPDVPVLALGAGITLLGVLRTLGRRGVPTFTLADEESVVRHCRWYRPVPGAPPVGPPPPTLAEFLGASPLESAVLMPCSDEWSREVARLDDELSRRFPASLSRAPVQEVLVDKARFAGLLKETDTPHPRTVVLDGPADLESVDDEILTRGFLKPRDSQAFFRRFRVKAYRPRTPEDLATRMRALADEGIPMILQEYVPGPPSNHYFVDGFVDREGRVRARMVRRRLRMYPPDFGNSSYMRSVPADEAAPAVEAVEGLLTGLGYRGVYSAEFKRDARDGVFRLLEVNARPWWYVEFAARCGVDVIWMSYLDALGEALPDVFDYQVGRTLAFPRYDLFACLNGLRQGDVTVTGWIRSWMGSDRPVFSWDDPMPALREGFRNVGGSVGRRLGAGHRDPGA